MNNGEIEEGKMVLRAKIDMANPNMHFRDPIIYRVVKTPHHRTVINGKHILCTISHTDRAISSKE